MPRATKIVATLGPASSSPEVLEQLLRAGVDVVRLNFSHGTAQDHINRANLVREIASLRDTGVNVLRVSPQSQRTVEVLNAMRAACDGTSNPPVPQDADWCDGFWHGRPGLERVA